MLSYISGGKKPIQDNVVIATKFAAYPWRLTPAQFVNACKYALYNFDVSESTFSILLFLEVQQNSLSRKMVQI